MLKYKTVKIVDYNDLNDLINQHVPMVEGAKFNYQQAYECHNDSIHWLDAVESEWTAEDEEELAKLLTWEPVQYGAEWGRNVPCDFEVIVAYLVNKGLIEPGQYKIHVSW